MGPIRTALATGVALTGIAAVIAAGAPSPRHARPTATGGQAAEAQLLAALTTRVGAARALESATLAAVEQRLRAIYAMPTEDPLMIILAGNLQQAEALGELESAMARSDEAVLSEYTNALANLQTAQAELAQNMLRITAARRIALARRAATDTPTPVAVTLTPAPAVRAPGGGLPSSVAAAHSLPGPVPIDPHTGRPYPLTGTS